MEQKNLAAAISRVHAKAEQFGGGIVPSAHI
jgi:hypothetical protein